MSRASRRVQKYLQERKKAGADGTIQLAGNRIKGYVELTDQDLQRVLDERKGYRAAAHTFEETIAGLQEQLRQVKLDASSPSRREMRLQERLDRIGTDEAVTMMKSHARSAQEAWRAVPSTYHNKGLSLAPVIYDLVGKAERLEVEKRNAVQKAEDEHGRANRLEAQLGNAQEEILRLRQQEERDVARAKRLEARSAELLATINEAAGRKADEADSGVSRIKEARAYQINRNRKKEATQAQLIQAAQALLLRNNELYPFGTVSWDGIARRGRSNQLAHAGACIAALIDRLPQQPASMKRRLPEDAIDFAPEN